MWKCACTVLLLTLSAGCGTVEEAPEPPPPVEEHSGLALLDLYGRNVYPLEADSAVVFILTRTDCPISNRYAPEVQRLMEEYGAHVDFWLVYPDPEESPGQIAEHVHDYGYRCGVLRDVTHQLVDMVGAEVTPEAAVFSPDGRLVYSGRIDDRYVDFGKARPQATIHDLERVLLAVLAGDYVASTRTRAVGCPIPELL
jgi:hypothetical protein